MAGDGSAVKKCTSTGGVEGLLKSTRSVLATRQNIRWVNVRDKVQVKWKTTVGRVRSTLSLFKSKKSKSSRFSEELNVAKQGVACRQKIWGLSLLRRANKGKAFSLDASRATKQSKGGWSKASRPSQTGRRTRRATRRVGPKMSARKKEVLAWSNLMIQQNSNQATRRKALEHLQQQVMQTTYRECESMASLTALAVSVS